MDFPNGNYTDQHSHLMYLGTRLGRLRLPPSGWFSHVYQDHPTVPSIGHQQVSRFKVSARGSQRNASPIRGCGTTGKGTELEDAPGTQHGGLPTPCLTEEKYKGRRASPRKPAGQEQERANQASQGEVRKRGSIPIARENAGTNEH